MKIDPLRGLRSRAEFEHNIHHLKEASQSGHVILHARIELFGLLRIRKLPNGRVDMLSINESARLMANMMARDYKAMHPSAFGEEPTEQGGED
ncbi:MAG: AVAST type 1 anti-phage system protein Avs1c [Myxococcota bacterium]